MKDVPEKKRSYPVYQYIGYYHTRREALDALAEYNRDPFDGPEMTLQELFEAWSDAHSAKIKPSTLEAYAGAFRITETLFSRQIQSLKLSDFQQVAEASGKNYPILKRWKVVLGMLYDHAVKYELVRPEKRQMIRNIDLSFAGNPNKVTRTVFTKEEIALIWSCGLKGAGPLLVLLYSGLRVSELLDLKKKDVDLERRVFYVRASKTPSGIREVPIAEKTVPFWEEMLATKTEYVVPSEKGVHYTYDNFHSRFYKPIAEALHLKHTLHETRHTFISRLTELGVDARIIKKLVGHSTPDVTEGTYTHITLEAKLEAVNRL